MKKILTVLFVCVSYFQSNGQYRYCDVAIRFESPKDGETVTDLSSLSFSFWLINQGPDSIFSWDSLNYQMSIGVASGEEITKVMGQDIAPRDSVLFLDSFYTSKEVQNGNLSLFFLRRVAVFSPKPVSRPLFPEVSPYTGDNSDHLSLFYKKNTASVNDIAVPNVVVFPNPVFNSTFSVRMQNVTDTKLRIYDITGREFQFEIFEVIDKNNIMVSVLDLSRGMYFLAIDNGNSSSVHRLIIN